MSKPLQATCNPMYVSSSFFQKSTSAVLVATPDPAFSFTPTHQILSSLRVLQNDRDLKYAPTSATATNKMLSPAFASCTANSIHIPFEAPLNFHHYTFAQQMLASARERIERDERQNETYQPKFLTPNFFNYPPPNTNQSNASI